MELKRKGKCRHGFTMTEVLAVVAVVAVTLAIGVPAIIGSVRRSNLKKLDDSARSIFLAAQNSLTAMVGNGELEDFAMDGTNEIAEDLYKKLGNSAPSDFPDGLIDSTDPDKYAKDLRFLDSENSAHKEYLKKIVPGGSIDKELENGRYIVEYNRASGAVYAVWYSDEKEFKTESFDHEPRKFEERLKEDKYNYPIGYYGGSGVDYALVGQMPIPELTVINAEELRLQVTMPDASFNTQEIKVDVVMEGLTSHATATIIDGADLDVNETGKVVLDTLKTGYTHGTSGTMSWGGLGNIGDSFEGWADEADPTGPAFIPGEDIKLTVTTRYNGIDGEIYLPQTASVTTNSLFARVEEKDDPDTPVEEAIPTAMIAYGRHLQNLDSTISGVTGITAAEQVQAIDFGANNDSGDDDNDVYFWKDTYPDQKFTAIYNTALTSYNGHSLPISNMDAIDNPGQFNTTYFAKAAGLFANVVGKSSTNRAKLQNITLIEAKATSRHNAGAVAGMAEYTEFVNCQVYLLNPMPAATGADYPEKMIRGRYHVGGLVGIADHSLFTDCFAATVVGTDTVNGEPPATDSRVGGLIGELVGTSETDSHVGNCYAACYLTGTRLVAGLIGYSAHGGVSDCYAAGIIAQVTGDIDHDGYDGIAAGLGCIENPLNKNCYAAVRFGKQVIEASKKDEREDGSVVVYGAKRNYNVTTNDIYYVRQLGVKYAENSGTRVTTKKLSEMTDPTATPATPNTLSGDWYQLPAEKEGSGADPDIANPTYATFPYNQIVDPKIDTLQTPYPYPMLLAHGVDPTSVAPDRIPMLHYGDWLEQKIFGYMLYWEKEGDDTYHFYTKVPDTSDPTKINVVSTLCTNYHLTTAQGQSITAWGYALIGEDLDLPDGLEAHKSTDTVASMPPAFGTALNDFMDDPLFTDTEFKALVEEGYITLFDHTSEDAYYTIETDEGWLEFNLAFAAAVNIAEPGEAPTAATTKMGTVDDPYQIRTVRQLDNIPSNSRSYFKQTHDLNGTYYGTGYSGAESFYGTYDGGSYRILEISINTNNIATALFRNIEGGAVLKHIILYSPTGDAVIETTATANNTNVGALVGTVASNSDNPVATISYCVAAGYTLKGAREGCGGLVGYVGQGGQLDISNCAAVNTLEVNRGVNAGGIVGKVFKDPRTSTTTVSIKDSYAGGVITGSTTGVVGGIVGTVSISVDSCTYNNVYSYVDMSGVTGTTNVYGIGPKGTTSGSGYTNCSYWEGGLGDNTALALDKDETNVTPVSLKDLKDAAAPAAQHTYRPGATLAAGLTDLHDTDNYPFAAKVTGPNGELVHYGEWPELVEAAFYWEKEKENDPATPDDYVYHFYTVGYLGGSLITGNDLCDIHHTETADHEIVAWGYGLYAKDSAYIPTLSDGTLINDFTVYADDEGARNEWLKRYSDEYATPMTADNIRMYAYATEDKFVTAESHAKSGKIYELNLGFARAIDVTEILPGAAAPTVPTNMGKETTLANPAYTPYYIRTVRQLDNIKDNDRGCYEQSHDLYGAYNYNGTDIIYPEYEGADNFHGQYDGQYYRVLELTDTLTHNRQGGMFAVLQGATLRNIIMFSPNGTATITGNSGNSEGGLALSVEYYNGNVTTIENCVVAGYTITTAPNGRGLGGLVGVLTSGRLVINNSAAVNTLYTTNTSSNAYIGGLVGELRTGTLTINNSYAGGTIRNGVHVGGIVGYSGTGTATYTNVYSYVNMSAVSPDEVYGIGPNGTSGTYTNCYYWNVGTGGKSVLDDDSINDVHGVNFSGLKGFTGTYFGLVANTYRVKLMSGDYPFPAVVRDQDGALVHYGDWPVLEEAALYWEQENLTGGGSVYHVHLVGFLNSEQLIYDDLCTVYHPEYSGHEITNWGYATINLNFAPGSAGLTDSANQPNVTNLLNGMFGAIGTWNFYETNATSSKSVTLVSTHGHGLYYVDPGFAAAIEWVESGSGTMGTSSKPFQIRTIQQLDNIPSAQNGSNYIARYFEQSHDLYGSSYSYTAPEFFAGEYDGGSYRILDLVLTGTTGYQFGLFGVLEQETGKSVTVLRDIILFSRTGVNVDVFGHSMGGLALAAGNNGSSANITIDNCIVSGYNIKGSKNVGGLVGAVNAHLTITNSEAVNTLETSSTISEGIGGLVGEVRNNASVAITNSYAGGTIKTIDADVNVGGLVGRVAAGGTATYENVYSYMNLTGVMTSNVYGIGPIGTYNGSNYYWLVGVSGKNVLDEIYVTGVNFGAEGTNSLKTCMSTTPGFGQVSNDSYTKPTTLNNLDNKKYPFSAVVRDQDNQLIHYGDWPMPQEVIFYWEKEGSDYHFYFYSYINGDFIFFNDLTTTGTGTIGNSTTDWGYGIYDRFANSTNLLPTVSGTEITDTVNDDLRHTVESRLEYLIGEVSNEEVKFKLFTNNTDPHNTDPQVQNIDLGELQCNLNLAFAAAVERGSDALSSQLGTADHPYQIRNVQQLDNIPNGTDVNTPETGVYSQTHDLNGTGYTGGYSGSHYFGGTYYGNGYQIRELTINNTTAPTGDGEQGGLFVYLCNGATLNGITLSSNSSAQIKDTGTHGIGGLAMGVYGNVGISQCSVTGYIISVENPNPSLSGNSVGGLVGFVEANGQLTITDCSAVNTLKAPDRNVANGVGGLVGEVRTGGTVEITDSHAGGSIDDDDPNDHVGGIVGNVITPGSVTYTNVSSSVDMSDSVVTAACYGIGPGANEAGNTGSFSAEGLQGKYPLDATETNVDWTNAGGKPTSTCTCTFDTTKPDQLKCAPGSPLYELTTPCELCQLYPWLCDPTTGDPGVSEGPGIVDEYYCTCTGKCTDDAINNDCPLCSWNHGECNPGANSGSGTDAPTDPTDPTEGDPTEPTDPTDPTEPTEGDPTEATEGSNEPDLTGEVQMPQAALPPDPPEEVPDPTPSEPDPGTGGKEEEPE